MVKKAGSICILFSLKMAHKVEEQAYIIHKMKGFPPPQGQVPLFNTSNDKKRSL